MLMGEAFIKLGIVSLVAKIVAGLLIFFFGLVMLLGVTSHLLGFV